MDHWEALPKLRELHRIAGASTKPTGLARLCSPYVAHLMVNPRGRLQLFHHFHHNVDDGLNDRTDKVWALQCGPSMAHAVAIRPGHLLNRQMGFHMDWTRMLTWNSTDDILDDVQRQLDLHAAKEEKPGQPPPAAGRSVRALASSTTTKRKPTASKGCQRQVEPL
jgi:hypothetical protein